MKEIWKSVKNYEDKYMISDRGRIKTVGRYIVYRKGTSAVYVKQKILKPAVNPHGYKHIKLCDKRDYSIHRLVAIAFLENPEIDHIDGNKLNNKVSNLEWVSYEVNNKRAYDLGLKKRIHAGQFAKGGGRIR